jgi:hypothetical protein
MKTSYSQTDFAAVTNNRRRHRRAAFVNLKLAALFLTAFALFILQPTAQAAGSPFFDFYRATANPLIPQSDVWERAERPSGSKLVESLPDDFNTVRLNKDALVSILRAAPHEAHLPLGASWTILPLPMPDGSMAEFRIQEAPVLEPEMAARFPEIKSYRAVSVNDPTVTGRFDLTPLGFHGLILTNERIVAILPAESGDTSLYASFTDEHISPEKIREMCSVTEERLKDEKVEMSKNPLPEAAASASGAQLRTYRIAVATTWEYSNFFGGTTAATVASINTWINGLNAIYEREVAIRLLLVNNTNILFTTDRGFTAATDPFTDGNDVAMLNEAVPVMNQHVGFDNFNVGHVFASRAGRAGLGVVCGPFKARGASTMTAPAGDIGRILHFAHELGHQFDAPHTFNGTGACAEQRAGSNAFETGSGTTIMSYAGNCSGHNLELPTGKEARFHARTIEQITNFTVNGTGAACPIVTQTGNTPPTVTAPAAFNIPKNTPFTLTATANDPDAGDNNNLTYTWEQYDAAGDFSNGPYTDAGDPANTTRPIFRPFAPTRNPSRTFPSLKYILNNANDPPDTVPGPFSPLQTAEELPRVGRTLNFRVTVRDNIGGVNHASTRLTVDGNSGPFNVTAPNTAVNWAGGSTQNVTWNVANTNNAPVSAANVKISLSTDGGQSFPIVLEAGTPNDGAQNVNIPNGVNTTTARIKIEAVGNVFFDISDTNFTITPGDACPVIADINPKVAAVGNNVVITGANLTGVTAVRFGGNVNATFTVDNAAQITATVPAGAIGGAVTLVKAGCGDAQTSLVTICQGAPATLQVDNGTIGGRGGEGTINNVPQTARAYNRLTPASYPATISSVIINVSDRLPIGTPINIHVGVNPGGTNNIDGTQLVTYARTVTAQNNFAAYPIPALTITSGDFVVGYSYTTGTPGSNFDGAPAQNRSYRSPDGINFVGIPVNYMIRAQIFTGECTPASCGYNINPTTQNFAGGGGNGTVNITTGANCPWTAARSASWISFTSPSSGTGGGALNFTVAANNTAAARTGTITVGDKTFTVTQEAGNAPTCAYTLNPAGGIGYPSGQQTGRTLTVTTGANCQWTATADQNWITITGGATGTGSGTVTYSLAANTGAARTGTITVQGQNFTVTQAAGDQPCTPITVGLLNWYRAEDNALDARSGNNGTPAGTLNYGEGNPGRGFVFNGANSVVSVQRQIADDFTVEFWVKVAPDVTGGANETDWKQGMGLVGTANDDFGVSLGNGKILFGVGNATIASQFAINDDFWYHVVATRNRTTGAMRLYIDGMNNQPVTGTGGTNALNGSPQLLIGRRGTNGAFFAGSLDEIKIYAGEFSDDQARAAFQGCAAGLPQAAIQNQTVTEGNPNPNAQTYVAFPVRLSQPTREEVCVHYYTEDLTAIEGIDYVGDSGSIVIPPGETNGTIFIPIFNDTNDEPDRQFKVIIYDPINSSISDDEAIGTIIDDDSPCEASLGRPGVSLSADGSSGHTFTVEIPQGCEWSAFSPDSWIAVLGGRNITRNGSGTVTFYVGANMGTPRAGVIVAAGQTFAVNQAAAPIPALFSISGRVVAAGGGSGIRNAHLTLTDQAGGIRTTRTDSSGNYSFTGLPAGTYFINVLARGRTFDQPTRTLTINADTADVNFTAIN